MKKILPMQAIVMLACLASAVWAADPEKLPVGEPFNVGVLHSIDPASRLVQVDGKRYLLAQNILPKSKTEWRYLEGLIGYPISYRVGAGGVPKTITEILTPLHRDLPQ